jgi:hypothetical protein
MIHFQLLPTHHGPSMPPCDVRHPSNGIHDKRMTDHLKKLDIAGTVAIGKRLCQINARFVRQLGDQFALAGTIGEWSTNLSGKAALLLFKFGRQHGRYLQQGGKRGNEEIEGSGHQNDAVSGPSMLVHSRQPLRREVREDLGATKFFREGFDLGCGLPGQVELSFPQWVQGDRRGLTQYPFRTFPKLTPSDQPMSPKKAKKPHFARLPGKQRVVDVKERHDFSPLVRARTMRG